MLNVSPGLSVLYANGATAPASQGFVDLHQPQDDARHVGSPVSAVTVTGAIHTLGGAVYTSHC